MAAPVAEFTLVVIWHKNFVSTFAVPPLNTILAVVLVFDMLCTVIPFTVLDALKAGDSTPAVLVKVKVTSLAIVWAEDNVILF
tara:strand:+ start:270 stop:518 length:249 start_codon:yes stop_codon:yes gene_type:complete